MTKEALYFQVDMVDRIKNILASLFAHFFFFCLGFNKQFADVNENFKVGNFVPRVFFLPPSGKSRKDERGSWVQACTVVGCMPSYSDVVTS